jgi:dipeptidase
MCDTFVALGNATRDGSVIFGKNSDREPNEAQVLSFFPHSRHTPGSEVQCTYIQVPQVRETHAVLLSKPFWIWGAEMGANEHGLVIGNEALFTKVPYGKEPGLIGMDFLRLALERAATADEALSVIIQLLETYGQGGSCGFRHPLFYHNGFLIADPESAWVLETAGRHWAAQRVQDVRSISNVISIGSAWDRASDDLVGHAIRQGWCRGEESFHFSRCYSEPIYTKFAAGRHRLCRTTTLLQENLGRIDLTFAMELLRDHGPLAGAEWLTGKGLLGAEVCMHASFGPVRRSQTTGSMISVLTPQHQTHWLTGTAAPCTTVFKPVWMDSGLPDMGPPPTGTYDEVAYWWQHENLHREILRDYSTRISRVVPEREAIEEEWIAAARSALAGGRKERAEHTRQAFEAARTLEKNLLSDIKALPVKNWRPLLDRWAWHSFDREARRPT